MTAANRARAASLLPAALLTATLFLLSADLLFVTVAGNKVKYGYFVILAMWLVAPAAMYEYVKAALSRVPRYAWLPLLPLAISVAASVNPLDSLKWALWLAFDLFTIATVYAFLKAHAFSGDQVRTCVTWSLALIAGCAALQFVAIYGFQRIVFQPQSHFDVYRINGVSGWPHFLNIFAFLLLPIVLVQRKLRWTTALLLALLMFMIVQSTAKTGWVLFLGLGCLLMLLDRRVFVKSYLWFLLPVTIVALLIPTPSYQKDAPPLTGSEKVTKFSADLNLADATTSGNDRLLISRMGLAVWWQHPWFGVGPRAYDDYVFSRFDDELPGVNKLDANLSLNARNENIWVEFLAECGALFTLSFVFVLCKALWVRRWEFANRLHLGAWIALVLYFGISGQFSQTGLLTMVYAVFGVCFYARELTSSNPPSVEPATVFPAHGAAALSLLRFERRRHSTRK